MYRTVFQGTFYFMLYAQFAEHFNHISVFNDKKAVRQKAVFFKDL